MIPIAKPLDFTKNGDHYTFRVRAKVGALLVAVMLLGACSSPAPEATPTPVPTSPPAPTDTSAPLATPTSPALPETSFIEPIRKQVFDELVDAQGNIAGEEVRATVARQWGISVDAAEKIVSEGLEKGWFMPTATPVPPTPTPTATPVAPIGAMVFIPAGEFIFKAVASVTINADTPLRMAYLDDYCIGQYEVTNGEYKRCVDVGACNPPAEISSSTRDFYYGNPEYDNYPVIRVNWYDAKAYCEWKGMRLPTEAEWMKAARGTDNRFYPWGDTWRVANRECLKWCNILEGRLGDTTPVGNYPLGASPYGVMDMAGNVLEWTADWYGSHYGGGFPVITGDQTVTPVPVLQNPTGPSSGSCGGMWPGECRVLKGGSWNDTANEARLTHVARGFPHNSYNHIGFRCVASGAP